MKIKSKYFLIFSGIFAVFLLAGTVGSAYVFFRWLETPFSKQEDFQLVEVRRGASLSEISSLLKNKNFISNTFLFTLAGRMQSGKNVIKAGEYLLSPSMPPSELFEILHKGKEHLHPFTIPEGYNLYEIATLVHEKGIGSKEKFLELALDETFISKFPFVTGKSLEGYLFPSTYFFRKGVTEEVIIKKMLSTFKKTVHGLIAQKATSVGLTPKEVLTMASLVEKETGQESERTLISSVFFNRLKRGMKLQCDPTVIYAIKDFDGNIRKKDLRIDSPYNTYRYKGLPPGPIANPGKNSIVAVLSPATTKFLYFVATKKGGHYFSRTLKEHNRAVRKYQLRKRKKKS